jgi:hypothetical protein
MIFRRWSEISQSSGEFNGSISSIQYREDIIGHGPRKHGQAGAWKHFAARVVFFTQLFDPLAGVMADTVDRTKNQIGLSHHIVDLPAAVTDVSVMVDKFMAARFHPVPVKGFHFGDTAHKKYTFGAGVTRMGGIGTCHGASRCFRTGADRISKACA